MTIANDKTQIKEAEYEISEDNLKASLKLLNEDRKEVENTIRGHRGKGVPEGATSAKG